MAKKKDLKTSELRSRRVTIPFTESMYQTLSKSAHDNYVTLSEYIRSLLQEKLSKK